MDHGHFSLAIYVNSPAFITASFHCMHAVFLLHMKISMKCEGRYLTLAFSRFNRDLNVSRSHCVPIHSLLSIIKQAETASWECH